MELTRTLTLLLLLTLSAFAQTPRIPPPESVNRNGLVGRWLVPGYQTGNGLTPTKAMDASGNGNHGTTSGSPNYGVIYSRPAMTFNGSSQYVTLSSTPLPAGTATPTNFTIAAWVYFSAISGTKQGRIFNQLSSDSIANQNIAFFVNTNSKLYYDVFPPSGGYLISPEAVVVGRWYHLAITRNGSSRAMYVNGVAVASDTAAETYEGLFDVNVARIGNLGTANEHPLIGYVTDLRIYSRSLPASAISAFSRGLQ
jgi:hypothetical protein